MNKLLSLLLGLPTAILLIKYRRNVGDFIGPVDFAEKYLGSGGTYSLVIIIAFAVFVLSLMYAFGTFQEIFGGLATPFTGG
ncbi:MAG: hypothetical protein NTX63_04240 [Candidatus Peregrinibacteria bacterium]|nr:hypothetical protein [Candidatus Peregrinibacteria bacterium]